MSMAPAQRSWPTFTRSRPIQLLLVCGLVLVAAIAISTAFLLSNLREQALADSERELQNIALVLAEQADRTFQALELVQTSLIERMQSHGIDSREEYQREVSGHDMHLILKDKIDTLPQVDAVAVIDADGKLINSSRFWPIPAIDVSDREFFKTLKADAPLRYFVTEPILNSSTNSWTLYLARKIAGPNSEFIGLVLGAMQMQYFEQLFASIALGPGSAITLFRGDGVLLARHPRVESVIGRSYADHFITLTAESDSSVDRRRGLIRDEPMIIAAHRVAHYPLVVSVGRSFAAALAKWQTQAAYLLGAAVLLILAIAGGVALIARQLKNYELLAQARTEKAEAEKARAVAEAELLKKQRLSILGQLTATVAHELRNPLSAIRNTLPVMKEMAAGKGFDFARPMARIERSIARCDRLVSSLLDYSKPRALSLAAVEINHWLGELLEEQEIPETVTLRCDFCTPDVVIQLDTYRFRRVVINLLDNAVQASRQEPAAAGGTTITISTRVRDQLALTIADTGPGIAPDVLPRIFEPLFSTKNFGTGLGLPAAQQIVEQHGGAMSVDSEFGRGTSICITMPLSLPRSVAA
jgi:signal transduction histidine kinase